MVSGPLYDTESEAPPPLSPAMWAQVLFHDLSHRSHHSLILTQIFSHYLRGQYNTNYPLPRRSSRLVQHCIVLRRAGRVDEDCRGAKVKCRCHCSRQRNRCCHRRASLAAPTKIYSYPLPRWASPLIHALASSERKLASLPPCIPTKSECLAAD